MKKNTILSALMALAILACTIFISDGLTYLITSLMALVIMIVINRNRSMGMKMTRWAKANPKKAQVLITIVQAALMSLAIFSGYNLKEVGYEFSNATAYIFSTIMVISFLSVPFMPKRSTIAIPKVLHRHRLAYMAIALSSFVIMAIFGNRLIDDYPDSPITQAARAIDEAIFPESVLNTEFNDTGLKKDCNNNYEQAPASASSNKPLFAVFTISGNESIAPSLSDKEIREKAKTEKKAYRLEKKKARMMKLLKHRLALEGGSTVLAVILIILLIFPLCAGICLMLGAFGEVTAGNIILGAIITGGSVWGMIAAGRMGRRQKNKPAE
jgi:hypothetical protein